jgi:hypothetical protein
MEKFFIAIVKHLIGSNEIVQITERNIVSQHLSMKIAEIKVYTNVI